MKPKVMLVIMDGWGIRRSRKDNAVKLAHTPFIDSCKKQCLYTMIEAAEGHVGLLPGIMGNSEVGHMNLGSGRIVLQELTRINHAIRDKTFFSSSVFLKAMKKAGKTGKSRLHLAGLLSKGGVHADLNHLLALIETARRHGVKKVYLHLFLDGRDMPETSSIKMIEYFMKSKYSAHAQIATIIGRYYAMDRDNRWNREKIAYDLLTKGKGTQYSDPVRAIKEHHQINITDEFMKPILVDEDGTIQDGDSLIFFNFRSDRMRQLTRAFTDKKFSQFRVRRFRKLSVVCMCEYDKKIKVPVAFPPLHVKNTIGEVLVRKKKKQLRIAETEKYPHVTFFFNGGVEKHNKLEKHIIIPSPKVPTYDMMPEMSAHKIRKEVLKQLGKFDFIVVNFANSDMVGHTGILKAAIRADEVVDACVRDVTLEAQKKGYHVIITADHGNSEDMQGKYKTSHTLNPVPFILIGYEARLRKHGALCDVAPTILQLMRIKQPKEMTGKSLII